MIDSTTRAAQGARRQVSSDWRCGLWSAAVMAICATPAVAEVPAFVGQWGHEQTCEPHEIVEYTTTTYESMFSYCDITDISELGAGQWALRAQCLYEGERNPISIRLHLAEGQLTERIMVEDRGHTSAYVRCLE